MQRKLSSRGFSLVELMVVIAILIAVISMMLPAVQRAREAANQTVCDNNLRQMGLGIMNYHTSHGQFPNEDGRYLNRLFHVMLLPYIEQQNVDPNTDTGVPMYLCPSRRTAARVGAKTDYATTFHLAQEGSSGINAYTVLGGKNKGNPNYQGTNLGEVSRGFGATYVMLQGHKGMHTKDYFSNNIYIDAGCFKTWDWSAPITSDWNWYDHVKQPNLMSSARDNRVIMVNSTAFSSPHGDLLSFLFADMSVRRYPNRLFAGYNTGTRNWFWNVLPDTFPVNNWIVADDPKPIVSPPPPPPNPNEPPDLPSKDPVKGGSGDDGDDKDPDEDKDGDGDK